MSNTEKNNVGDASSDLSNRSPNPSTSKDTTTSYAEAMKNYSNLCRVCGTVTEFEVPIFSGEGLQLDFMEKIHKYLPIKVTEQDVLPRHLCHQCANTLLAWDELYSCCQKADAAFQQQLEIAKSTVSQLNQISSQDSQDKKKSLKNSSSLVPLKKVDESANDNITVIIPLKLCNLCNTKHPVHLYKKHMHDHHNDDIFRCEECRHFIHNKEVVMHMAFHIAETMDESEAMKLFKKVRKYGFKVNSFLIEIMKYEKAKQRALNQETTVGIDEDNCDKPPQNKKVKIGSQESAELDKFSKSAIRNSKDSQDIVHQAIPTQPLTSSAQPDEIEPIATTSQEQSSKQKKARACPICAKIYTVPSSYFYHLKQHKNDKEYECNFCGKKFSSKACLSQHIAMHTGESSLKCKDCDKSFRTKASLYIHKEIHNGKKPYTCRDCPLTFRWRTQLKRHEKRHKEEKGHVCSMCDRGFKVHYDLLRHVRTHTAGKYQCAMCHIKFAQLRYLKVHILKKHPYDKKNDTNANN